MAKGNKPAKKNLKKRMVRVHSKRYGDHERSPRGTFTPVELNEAMVASKNRLLKEKKFNDIHCLRNLECHAVHTLSKILRSYVFVKVAGMVDNQLPISVCIEKAPQWRTKHLNGFLLSIHVIFSDLAGYRIEK